MRYLCLIYNDEAQISRMPKEEFETFADAHLALDDDFEAGGHLVASEALEPVATATTVRIRKGDVSVTDGPFAETKEQLGGFFLIEAWDLNEAIRLASKIPSVRTGSVEIRPISEGRCRQP